MLLYIVSDDMFYSSQVSDVFKARSDFIKGYRFGSNLGDEDSHIHSKCHHPICPPGHEKVFGEIPNNESSLWDAEYGYHCVPCQVNHYKNTFGDEECRRCPGYFVSNSDRSACIDPLVPVFMK